MANEQTEKILKLLKEKADKLFLAGMGVLLAAQGYLWFDEKSTPDLDVVPPTPRNVTFVIGPPGTPAAIDPKTKLPAPVSENYELLDYIVKSPPPFDLTDYRPLADFNMFDAKAAKDSDQLEKSADKLVDEARQLRDDGKTAEAKAALEKALKTRIGHKGAEALLAEIEAKPAGGEQK